MKKDTMHRDEFFFYGSDGSSKHMKRQGRKFSRVQINAMKVSILNPYLNIDNKYIDTISILNIDTKYRY